MTEESLRLTEGGSDKFWRIKLEGDSFTVHFGRVGTTGQAQTKTFASESDAKIAFDKLLAEKLKKGYERTGEAVVSMPEPVNKAASRHSNAIDQPALENPPASLTEPNGKKARLVGIKLPPEVLARAAWTPVVPARKSTTPPRPFDLHRLMAELEPLIEQGLGYEYLSNAGKLCYKSPFDLTKEEACLWLVLDTKTDRELSKYLRGHGLRSCWHCGTSLHMGFERLDNGKYSCTCPAGSPRMEQKDFRTGRPINVGILDPVSHGKSILEQTKRFLEQYKYDQGITESLFELMKKRWHIAYNYLCVLMVAVLTPEQQIELALNCWPETASYIMDLFKVYTLPNLDQAELEKLRATCRKRLNPVGAADDTQKNVAKGVFDEIWSAYFVAAGLRMTDELAEMFNCFTEEGAKEVALTGKEEETSQERSFRVKYYIRNLIFSLGSPNDILQQAKRFKLRLTGPLAWNMLFGGGTERNIDNAQTWLACTGAAGLQYIAELNATAENKEVAGKYFALFDCIDDDDSCVEPICSLLDSPQLRPFAHRWLVARANVTAPCLYNLSQGRGNLATRAKEVLASVRSQLDPTLAGAELFQSIQAMFKSAEDDLPEMDQASTPTWLASALATVKPTKAKLADWMDPSSKPRIIVGGKRLTTGQMTLVLHALKQSSLDSLHPLLAAFQANEPRRSTDNSHGAYLKTGWPLEQT